MAWGQGGQFFQEWKSCGFEVVIFQKSFLYWNGLGQKEIMDLKNDLEKKSFLFKNKASYPK